ncbi:MAG: hypothetical protein K0B15_11425 [Lentimicrobium sp.]|nr:hypothetical protein [Lentimicrobium sp.]
MIKKINIGFLLLLFGPVILLAQNNFYSDPEECLKRSGIEYGGIAGFYIPGNGTAGFYSGKPENENNANYILKNKYWYDEIYQRVGAYDTIFIREYPEKMKYNPAFSFGLFVKYAINCRSGFYLQFHYAKLTAKDFISFEVDPPIDYLAEPDIRLYPVIGIEERNMVDLGYSHAFGNNPVSRFIIGGGINMNNTLVKESVLRIEDKPFNMVNRYSSGQTYIPGAAQQTYEFRQGGIGFGIFGTLGGRFEFSPAVAIEPGIAVYYKKINLEAYNGFYPQFNIFVKLCFRDLVSFAQ